MKFSLSPACGDKGTLEAKQGVGVRGHMKLFCQDALTVGRGRPHNTVVRVVQVPAQPHREQAAQAL